MNDLSNLSRGLGSVGGAQVGAKMGDLAVAIQDSGGLDGLLGRLREGGLADEVDSWVSTGANQPVDPGRLGEALGPDTVQQLSTRSGLDIQALLPLLAAFLPQLINMLTPSGRMPEGGLDNATSSGGLGDLGGLLGGLLGGGQEGGVSGVDALDDLLQGLGGQPREDEGR